MGTDAATLIRHGWGALAPLLTFALMVLAALIVRRTDRRRLAFPTALLLAHLLLTAAKDTLALSGRGEHLLGLLAHVALLAAVAQTTFLLIADGLLDKRLQRQLPRIFRDILQVLLYFGILLAALHAGGVEPGSLLTTSALLTAVIGLSLQDTLGNVFAGLALQAQKPFDIGDWVQLADSTEPLGQVVEVNWRATRIATRDRIEVIVPNSVLARGAIRNLSKPTELVRRSVLVDVPYDMAPAQVHKLLLSAIADTPGVLSEPPTSCVTDDFAPDGVRYRLRFYVSDIEQHKSIEGAVRDRVWYALKRAGIAFPSPQREVRVTTAPPPDQADLHAEHAEQRAKILRRVDLFAPLADADLRHLAERLHSRSYAPTEAILREGDAGDELFLVEQGEVAILLKNGSEEIEVARLHAGQFFGEMSLLTGERRTATVRAITECRLLVVGKSAFQDTLRDTPGLAERISAILATRQQELGSARQANAQDAEAEVSASAVILSRIRSFFDL